ncbi:unnamed protein product [Prorocentrum cordatum]|uniref:Uncharacterized protein n=1 Tax=Prorocentrum cordatum TaxID=2364126 RepID=A0ABN9TZ51_9DINO|nr:unnamed protein product [Polarella glacialis]
MSTDPVVLGSLSEVCGAPLQLFELVAVVGDDGDGDGAGSMAYLCLGRQHISGHSPNYGWSASSSSRSRYTDCAMARSCRTSRGRQDRAVVDEASRSLFLVVIRPGQDTTWRGGDRLLVRSQQRELLLERLALCWQTQQMHERFQVRRLPQARASITSGLRGTGDGFACRVLPQVEPFRGYVQESRRGYSFFVRAGFKSRGRCGRFICEPGWSVRYAAEDIELPGGVEIGIYTEEPRRHAGLVSGGHEDLRTVAIEYRTLLTKELQQLHVRVNRPFLKRMNRTGDIAAWDGWEFLVRSKRHLLACVVLRRKFIPPLCDTMQDVVVTLRCPVDALDVAAVTQSMCDVVREECCFVADSIAPVAEK